MDCLILSADYSHATDSKADHFHDCHQLLYIAEGSATVTVSKRQYTLRPGMAVMISRFEHHAIQMKSPDYCRYALEITPQLHGRYSFADEQLFSVLINRPNEFHHAVDLSGYPQAKTLLDQIVAEIHSAHGNKELMLDLLFLQLLVLIGRAAPQLLQERGEHLTLARQLQADLENRYPQSHTLASLAQQYHISQSHLSHIFKRVTGSSVIGYLTACRLAAAKRYLTETDMTVTQIVENCGFTDNSNFSRSFKEETGMTPSAFRQKYRH